MQPQALLKQDTKETEDQRGPDSQSPEWTPAALWETQESKRLRDRARGTDKGNVDSGELRVQCTRLKYKEGGTGKIQMKHRSAESLGKLSIHRERSGE